MTVNHDVAGSSPAGGAKKSPIFVGNHAFNPDIVKRVLDMHDYDIVVGSVHGIRYSGWDCNISKMDFKQFPTEWVQNYLEAYFQETLRTVAEEDIDVIAHFSFGVRYMACRDGQIIDITPHWNTIEQALLQMLSSLWQWR